MKKTRVLKTLMIGTLAIGFFTTPAMAADCHVRSGDSLWRIAKRYKVDFEELCRLNRHLQDMDVIRPKDRIRMPNGSQGAETDEVSTTDNITHSDEKVTQSGEVAQALEVLELVNQERKRQGLKELVLSHELNGIATAKAEDMAEKGYFDHNSPTYGSPFEMLQQFGVQYKSAGENIAAGQKTSKQVMDDWMNSSGHRANILNSSYGQLGVGYVEGGAYGTYWVQLFKD